MNNNSPQLLARLIVISLLSISATHAEEYYWPDAQHYGPAKEQRITPSAELTSFITTLKQVIAARDRKTLLSMVSDNFQFWQDHGGMFDPKASGSENFARIFLQGEDWQQLDSYMEATQFSSPMGNKTWVKMPAVSPAKSLWAWGEEGTRAVYENWYRISWSYVNGRSVNIRKGPSRTAEAITALSYQYIHTDWKRWKGYVDDDIYGPRGELPSGEKDGLDWILIRFGSERNDYGYIHQDYFDYISPSTSGGLDFSLKNGQWMISAAAGNFD